MTRCPACGHEAPGGSKFCNECGARLAAPATEARAALDRAPRDYTPRHLADKILRSKSALEGERKQVTVLFADVKSSMELAEQLDPEEWHGLLDRFFSIATEDAAAVLRNPSASADDRESAVQPVRLALSRLRAVVQDPEVNARERFRAHKLAGRIQLEIDDDPAAAERHFRTALEFDPRDRFCRLGLANALFLQAIRRASGDFAEAKLRVSITILNGLIDEAPSSNLVDRRAEVQHALDLVMAE